MSLSSDTDVVRRRRSRVAVLFLAIIGGGLFYWQSLSFPVDHQFVVVLTGVEKTKDGLLLRHEHIKRLEMRILNDAGETLATIDHLHPGAVARPATVHLPKGEYGVHITLHFRTPGGTPVPVNLMKRVDLTGDEVRLELGGG